MIKGQKSVRGGIEDFLCPFTDMYITQGSNGSYSHKGIMANDVRGRSAGVRYPYYAPCTVKCLRTYPESGQVMWQSTNKVRFANGRVDYATFMTAHDDSMDATVGMIVPQGNQLGNMGTKGNATGVHCHIQVSQSADTSWTKNQYGIYHFNNEYDLDDCYFVDNTNILKGNGGNWRTTSQVPVQEMGADQVIKVGSKVKFDGIFKVDIVNTKINCWGSTLLTGCSLSSYYHEQVKDYHWIPAGDFTETDSYGHATKDQVFQGGISYAINKNVYNVEAVDIPTNSVKLIINGRAVWVYATYLYEVSDR